MFDLIVAILTIGVGVVAIQGLVDGVKDLAYTLAIFSLFATLTVLFESRVENATLKYKLKSYIEEGEDEY